MGPTYTNAVSGVGTGAITYTSANPLIATVTPSIGVVTRVANGTTVITANKAASGIYSAVTNTYTLTVLGIGSAYQGGKIAYSLQSGEPGYNASVPHGLIAATADQDGGTGIIWSKVAYQSTAVTGTIVTIGSGSANTILIVNQNVAGSSYAAGLCDAYTNVETGTGVYSDWYLPSHDELDKLYSNKGVIGGFADDYYWSSSEGGYSYSWSQHFFGGTQEANDKDFTLRVRAVRSF